MAESFTPLTTSNLGGSISSITSAVDTNFSSIKSLLNDILSRSGSSPNTMISNLDMNNNKILNVGPPSSPTDLLRLQDVSTGTNVGVAGPPGPTGATGATGPQGVPGISGITNTVNLTGNITYTSTTSGPSNGGGIWTNNGGSILATGTSTDSILALLSNVEIDDRVNATAASNGLADYQFVAVTNSPATGSRTGFQTQLIYNGSADSNKNYAGAQIFAVSQQSNGGTPGNGNGRGDLFSLGLYSYLKTGAGNWNANVGLEIDVLVATGCSADLTVGAQVVRVNGDVVPANLVSMAYNANNNYVQGSGAGWDILYCDGSYAGQPALKTTGTLLGCYLHANSGPKPTIAYGIDLNNYAAITGAILRGPGNNGYIDGNFNVIASNLYGVGVYSATVVAPGTGYVPGDALTMTIPNSSVNSILGGAYGSPSFYVMSTKVVSATVAGGGSGGTSGTQTVTGTTGTGLKFTASVTVSGGAITAVNSITSGGTYQVNPTTLTSEPVTGGGLAGATLNIVMGALYINIQNPGSFKTVPSNPAVVSQNTTTGIGSGATFSLIFAPQASYVLPPSNASNGTAGSQASFNQGQGYLTLGSVTTGAELTAFGWSALSQCTSGTFNTAFGINALGNNLTTGSNNVAFGRDAGRNVNASGCTFIGDAAGQGNGNPSTGPANTAVGTGALSKFTSGDSNTVVGYQAGLSGTTDFHNTFIGRTAGFSCNGSNNNTFIGWTAGQQVTTGSSNLIVGCAGAGSTTLTTGNNNILIGTSTSTDTVSSSTNNTIVIGCTSGTTPWLTGSLVAAFPNAKFGGPVGTVAYTVATLPAASATYTGMRAYVTDATAPTWLGTLTGGGAVICPVFCNGIAWVSG